MNQQTRKEVPNCPKLTKYDFPSDMQTANIQSKRLIVEGFPQDVSHIHGPKDSAFTSFPQTQLDSFQNNNVNTNNFQEIHSHYNKNQQSQTQQEVKLEQPGYRKNQIPIFNQNQLTQSDTKFEDFSDPNVKVIALPISQTFQGNQNLPSQNPYPNSFTNQNSCDFNQVKNSQPSLGPLVPNDSAFSRNPTQLCNLASQSAQFDNRFQNKPLQKFAEGSRQNNIYLQQQNALPFYQKYDTFDQNSHQLHLQANAEQHSSNDYYGYQQMPQNILAHESSAFYNLHPSEQQAMVYQQRFRNESFPDQPTGSNNTFYQSQPYDQRLSQSGYVLINTNEQHPAVQILNQSPNQSNSQNDRQNVIANTLGNPLIKNSVNKENSFTSLKTINRDENIITGQFSTEAQRMDNLQSNEEDVENSYQENLIENFQVPDGDKSIPGNDYKESISIDASKMNSIGDDKSNSNLNDSCVNVLKMLDSKMGGDINTKIKTEKGTNLNLEYANELYSRDVKCSSSQTKFDSNKKEFEGNRMCEDKTALNFSYANKKPGDLLSNSHYFNDEKPHKYNNENETLPLNNNSPKINDTPNIMGHQKSTCSYVSNNLSEFQMEESKINNRNPNKIQANPGANVSMIIRPNFETLNIKNTSELPIHYQNQNNYNSIDRNNHFANSQHDFSISQFGKQSQINPSNHESKLDFSIMSQKSDFSPQMLNQNQVSYLNANQNLYDQNFKNFRFESQSNKNIPVSESENNQLFYLNCFKNSQKNANINDSSIFDSSHLIHNSNNTLTMRNPNVGHVNQFQDDTTQQDGYKNEGQFFNKKMIDTSQIQFLNKNNPNNLSYNNFANPDVNVLQSSNYNFQNPIYESKTSIKNMSQSLRSSFNQNQPPAIEKFKIKKLFAPFNFDPAKIIHFIKLHENPEENVFVEKFLVSETEFLKFSKLLSDESSNELIRLDSIEGIIINFEKLRKINAKFIGAFGRSEVLLEALVDNQIINECHLNEFEKYLNKHGPGLHMIPLNEDKKNLLIVLILFSNDKNDFDFANEKRDYTKLVRYLTQISNVNILAINQKDEELINFKIHQSIQRHNRFVHKKNQVEEEKFEIGNGSYLDYPINDINLFGDGIQTGFYTTRTTQPETKVDKFTKNISSKAQLNTLVQNFNITVADINKFDSNVLTYFIANIFHEQLESIYWKINQQVGTLSNKNQDQYDKEIETSFSEHVVCVAVKVMNLRLKKELEILKKYPRSSKEPSDQTFEKALKMIDETQVDQSTINILQKEARKCFLKSEKMLLKKLLQDNGITDFDPKNFETLSKQDCVNLIQQNHNHSEYLFWTKLGYKNLYEYMNSKRNDDKFMQENMDICQEDSQLVFGTIISAYKNIKESEKYKSKLREKQHNAIQIEVGKNVYYEFLKEQLKKDGNQNATLTNIKFFSSSVSYNWFTLELENTTTSEPLNVYKIYKFTVNQRDTENAKFEVDQVIKPKFSRMGETSLGESSKLVCFFFFKSDKIGIIINKNASSQIMFYDTTTQRLNEERKKNFGKTILLCDYNSIFKQVTYFSKYEQEVKVIIYQISEEMVIKELVFVDLKERFSIDDVKIVKIATSNSLIVVDNYNKIHLIDHKNCTKQNINSHDMEIERIFILPKTNCLVLINKEMIQPYIIESANSLPKIPNVFGLDPHKCEIGIFETQIQIMYSSNKMLKTNLLKCTLSTHTSSLYNVNSIEARNDKGGQRNKSVFDYFGFLYGKFSVHSPMDTFQHQDISQKLLIYLGHCEFPNNELEKKIRKKLYEIESNIKKPNWQMIGLESNARFLYPNQTYPESLFSYSTLRTLDRWIQDLICFVPIQIARTENSQFIILANGEPLYTKEFNNTYQLRKKITLGLYEPILKNWNKEIKVITSMGKQSTGKSYTLNHLSGASFAISAGRCTDGCWFTMKITEDCLYILLDFEGLGSFERSEQEDMLLSVMNASLSNITLYKTEFSINKDTDKMFNRFNQGANLLKGSEDIFKGVFCIIIKDARDMDVDELTKEFTNKMNIIVQRENEKDFLTTMYKSGFEIFAFHSLDVYEYYTDMENLKLHIQEEIKPIFKNGKDFLDLLKTIMAKMAIQDFTSLSRQDIDMRINMLNEAFVNAIHFGNISDKQTSDKDFALKWYDKNDTLIAANVEFEVEDKAGNKLGMTYDDTDIMISHSNLSFIEILENQYPRTHLNHNSWSEMLRVLIKRGIEKRMARVSKWIDANLEKWNDNSEFQDLINTFKQEVSHKSKEIAAKNIMCLYKCDGCHASCTLCLNHNEAHTCGQKTHYCTFGCDYCTEHKEENQEMCHLNFGHNEKHRCKQKPHTCDSKCEYEKCEHKCCQIMNHEGGHKCGLIIHYCHEKCSLPTCKNVCQINIEKSHQIHKCISEQCTKYCDVQKCTIRCASNDHFHCEPDLSEKFKTENGIGCKSDLVDSFGLEVELDFHNCGNVHACSEDCQKPGFCKKVVERKIENKEFEGKRDKFNFQKRYENVGSKLKCYKIIERLQKDHPGDHIHSHDNSVAHICTTKCPTCQNICDEHYGHSGKHNTSHANMASCYFIANENDVNVGSHKYVVGEPSVAEMCNMFCKSLGRGHVHIVECGDQKADCMRNGQPNMRHQTCKYGPNEDVTKDEIQHSTYWDLIGFEDPTQEIDKEDFHKCPYYCASREHINEKELRYCQLDLWHKPVSSLAEINKQNGVVSVDGHYFLCSHPDLTRGFLFILCLDDSGSMSGSRWNELSCAVTDFAISRRQATTDKLTIVQFNENPTIKCRNIPFKEFKAETHLAFRGGGTRFGNAIVKCHEILKQDYSTNVIPVFVFMSDGEDGSGDAEMKSFIDEFLCKELKIFTISFGQNSSKLKALALAGKGSYLQSIGGMELKRNFQEISSKFGTTISVLRSNL